MRPGLTEHNFRRFESVISEAVTNYPCEVTIKPTSDLTSLSTLAARLRDALRAYEVHRYGSTFKSDQFDKVRPKLHVTIGQSFVLLAPRDVLKPATAVSTARVSAPTTGLSVATDDLRAIEALLTLHDTGVFDQPTRLTTAQPIMHFMDTFDVGINQQGNNEYIIL